VRAQQQRGGGRWVLLTRVTVGLAQVRHCLAAAHPHTLVTSPAARAQAGRFTEAAAAYTEGLAAAAGDAGTAAALHCNRAACAAVLGRPAEAVADACAALALEPGYLRAQQRRAEGLAALGEHAAAAQVCVWVICRIMGKISLCFEPWGASRVPAMRAADIMSQIGRPAELTTAPKSSRRARASPAR
jgi:tetratricopeptide (TPR) repeat protein